MIQKAISQIEREQTRKEPLAPLAVGDTVKVHVTIREGDKERVQPFSGTVIAIRRGVGGGSFIVRRLSHGVAVEKIFPFNCPHVTKVEVERKSRVRRAKLYFLRERSGKKARLSRKE